MAIDHAARAQKAWPIIVDRARVNQPITYGELCMPLGLHHRAAAYFLGVIQKYCSENKLPPLQALVVNKRTRMPGTGYIGSQRTPVAHKKALAQVHKYKWPNKSPNFK